MTHRHGNGIPPAEQLHVPTPEMSASRQTVGRRLWGLLDLLNDVCTWCGPQGVRTCIVLVGGEPDVHF